MVKPMPLPLRTGKSRYIRGFVSWVFCNGSDRRCIDAASWAVLEVWRSEDLCYPNRALVSCPIVCCALLYVYTDANILHNWSQVLCLWFCAASSVLLITEWTCLQLLWKHGKYWQTLKPCKADMRRGSAFILSFCLSVFFLTEKHQWNVQ